MKNLSLDLKKSPESQHTILSDEEYSFPIVICTQYLHWKSRANRSTCIRVVAPALVPCTLVIWFHLLWPNGCRKHLMYPWSSNSLMTKRHYGRISKSRKPSNWLGRMQRILSQWDSTWTKPLYSTILSSWGMLSVALLNVNLICVRLQQMPCPLSEHYSDSKVCHFQSG